MAICALRGCGRYASYEGGYCGRDCLDAASGDKPKTTAHTIARKAVDIAPATSRGAILRNVIRRGWNTFVQVGEALVEMHDGKHYRELGHASFKVFCEAEGYSRSRVYQLMGSAKVSTMVDRSPNERQAREVAKIEHELGPEAAAKAVERAGPNPTAKKIREAAQPELEVQTVIESPCSHRHLKCVDCGEVMS